MILTRFESRTWLMVLFTLHVGRYVRKSDICRSLLLFSTVTEPFLDHEVPVCLPLNFPGDIESLDFSGDDAELPGSRTPRPEKSAVDVLDRIGTTASQLIHDFSAHAKPERKGSREISVIEEESPVANLPAPGGLNQGADAPLLEKVERVGGSMFPLCELSSRLN
jgi:hypothetical protein